MKNNIIPKFVSRIGFLAICIYALKHGFSGIIDGIALFFAFYFVFILLYYLYQILEGEKHLEEPWKLSELIGSAGNQPSGWTYENTHMTPQEKMKFREYTSEFKRNMRN